MRCAQEFIEAQRLRLSSSTRKSVWALPVMTQAPSLRDRLRPEPKPVPCRFWWGVKKWCVCGCVVTVNPPRKIVKDDFGFPRKGGAGSVWHRRRFMPANRVLKRRIIHTTNRPERGDRRCRRGKRQFRHAHHVLFRHRFDLVQPACFDIAVFPIHMQMPRDPFGDGAAILPRHHCPSLQLVLRAQQFSVAHAMLSCLASTSFNAPVSSGRCSTVVPA